MPKGIRREKLNRVFSIAEELCQKYLGKLASLPSFQEEKDGELKGEEVYEEKAITDHNVEPVADPFETIILSGEEIENGC